MSYDVERPLKFSSWEVVKRFLVISVFLIALIGIVTSTIYYNDLAREKKLIENDQMLEIYKLSEIITIHMDAVFSDLLIVAEHNRLLELIDSYSKTRRDALAEVFLTYSTKKRVFDQIRLLDTTGKEIVRVNFNNGDPAIVPDEKLQVKKKRYYFQDISQLDRGEMYISPFDLNVEYGQIEQPLKPTIRLATPILDSEDRKSGFLVLNYLGSDLLEHLAWIESDAHVGQIMLLNSDGHWLKSPNKEDEWGFMYETRTDLTFGKAFPDAWQQVNSESSGQLITEEGLFTFNTIYPSSESIKASIRSSRPFEPGETKQWAEDYYWKILTRVTPGELIAHSRKLLKSILLVDGVLLVTSMVILWILVYTKLLHKQAEKELEKHRGYLERLVEERTSELRVANEQLRKEITERKHAEEKIRKLNRELKRRVKSRTTELEKTVNLMTGREVRMGELKSVIGELQTQLESAGMRPVVSDPLKETGRKES
ncbi:MAG: hypothetical protein V3U24_05920 [Candidatus Neomarinimicrobiota bacterium]